MNTEYLREFLTLSETLNYSRAAERLFLSQSILTRHIQSLEAELGLKLLDRTTHGVSLTEAGRILSRQALSLLEQCENVLSILDVPDLPTAGTVRIACEVEISYASYVGEFISQFSARYPDIEIQLDVKPESALPEIVQHYDFLLTPVDCDELPPDTASHLIASHGVYAALPPGHSLMAKSLLALHQLSGETLLVPYAKEPFGPYAQNFQLAMTATRGNLGCIPVPNLSTALFMVSIRKGIALVPRYVRNMLPHDTILVGISDRSCRFNEYLYYHRRENSGAARLFYEEFRKAYIREL